MSLLVRRLYADLARMRASGRATALRSLGLVTRIVA